MCISSKKIKKKEREKERKKTSLVSKDLKKISYAFLAGITWNQYFHLVETIQRSHFFYFSFLPIFIETEGKAQGVLYSSSNYFNVEVIIFFWKCIKRFRRWNKPFRPEKERVLHRIRIVSKVQHEEFVLNLVQIGLFIRIQFDFEKLGLRLHNNVTRNHKKIEIS